MIPTAGEMQMFKVILRSKHVRQYSNRGPWPRIKHRRKKKYATFVACQRVQSAETAEGEGAEDVGVRREEGV